MGKNHLLRKPPGFVQKINVWAPGRAEPSLAEPSRAEPSRAEPIRAEPSRAELSRGLAGPSRAGTGPQPQFFGLRVGDAFVLKNTSF